MKILYTLLNWINGNPPARSAANLNHMDAGIKAACDILDLETDAGRALVQGASASVQRTALGLGDSATRSIGTGSGDAAAGDRPAAAVSAHESAYAHGNIPSAGGKIVADGLSIAQTAFDKLVLAYEFNSASLSGTALTDMTGGGKNAVIGGSPTPTSDGIPFDGSMTTCVGPIIGINSDGFSAEIKFKTSNSGSHILLSKRSASTEFVLAVSLASNLITFTLSGNGTTWDNGGSALTYGFVYSDGIEHTYTFDYNGTTRHIYLDGVLVATGTITLTLNQSTSSLIRVGTLSSGTAQATGTFYSVRIWNRVLSAAEILLLHSAAHILYQPSANSPALLPALSAQNMGWFGKTLAVIGDSMSTGAYTTTSWGKLLAAKFGMNFLNYAMNGAHLTCASLVDHATNTPTCYWYDYMTANADVIIAMTGGNDWIASVPLGTPADTTEITVYGAMKILCLGLLRKYIGKQIVFGIEPYFWIENTVHVYHNPSDLNELGLSWSVYAQALREVAAMYAIPVCDVGVSSMIYSFDATVRAALFVADGAHPNAAGHELIARRFAGFIRTLN